MDRSIDRQMDRQTHFQLCFLTMLENVKKIQRNILKVLCYLFVYFSFLLIPLKSTELILIKLNCDQFKNTLF